VTVVPTYQYLCEDCKYEFEKFQNITAGPLRKCPKCGKNRVKRLIGTGAGVIFKGSGFYQTDYRSESYKNAEKKDKEVTTEKKPAESKNKKAGEKSKNDAKAKEKPA
jgi:putative FmdB family regulatory protein